MNVELLHWTPEWLITNAYGVCTKKSVPVENIQKWLQQGHTSPIEQSSGIFWISGISRACADQLLRHRHTSPNMRSMRYVSQSSADFVYPNSILDNDNETLYGYALQSCVDTYNKLCEKGVPQEDARMIIPIGVLTSVQITANYLEWRYIIQRRCHKSAQWEIRELCTEILKQLYDVAPNVFGDLYEEYVDD